MADFTVTTLVDEADGGASIASPGGTGLSLREAISLSNANAGADTISFDSSLAGGVVYLTLGSPLAITGTVSIQGHLGADGRPVGHCGKHPRIRPAMPAGTGATIVGGKVGIVFAAGAVAEH